MSAIADKPDGLAQMQVLVASGGSGGMGGLMNMEKAA